MDQLESTLLTEGEGLRLSHHNLLIYLMGYFTVRYVDKNYRLIVLNFCYRHRFHLRWGCREILYDKSSDGNTYVTGVALSKVCAEPISSFSFVLQFICKKYEESCSLSVAFLGHSAAFRSSD